jgi:hypothetical protein
MTMHLAQPTAGIRTEALETGREGSFEVSFPARIRKFVWLSSGMFSAASLVMPALGIFALGASTEGLGANFFAGIASACVFALTSRLRFGPDEA